MRRRKLLAAAGLATLVAVGAVAMWIGRDRVTLENFSQIKSGMPLAEVEAILGPPGDYRTVPTAPASFLDLLQGTARPTQAGSDSHFFERQEFTFDVPNYQHWSGNTGDVDVYLNSKGVALAHFQPAQRLPQSALENLVWRARRHWRKWFP
jgi:hypothetical protein